MVERLDPARVGIVGGDEEEVRQFIKRDFSIRYGTCPNGCGLMAESDGGQECSTCHFWTNVQAEKGAKEKP